MVDVAPRSIVADPKAYEKSSGLFNHGTIREAGWDSYEHFLSELDFSKTKLKSIDKSKVEDFLFLRESLNVHVQDLHKIYNLNKLGAVLTEVLGEIEDPELFWALVISLYPRIWHLDLKITERFKSLPISKRQEASTRFRDHFTSKNGEDWTPRVDEDFFHMFDEIGEEDLITVYRTFSVDVKDQVRRGKAGTAAFFEWGNGLGWSFAPSKFPCIKINSFPGVEPFQDLGATPNQIKRSIRNGYFCAAGALTSSTEKMIAERRFVGSFEVQKKDVLSYIGCLGEKELLIDPSNVMLDQYRPLTVVDYWLTQFVFNTGTKSVLEYLAPEMENFNWGDHSKYENVDAIYDVLYYLISDYAKKHPRMWQLGIQAAVKIDDKKVPMDLMTLGSEIRSFLSGKIRPRPLAADSNEKYKENYPRKKFCDVTLNFNLDYWDRPFNPRGVRQRIRHLRFVGDKGKHLK